MSVGLSNNNSNIAQTIVAYVDMSQMTLVLLRGLMKGVRGRSGGGAWLLTVDRLEGVSVDEP